MSNESTQILQAPAGNATQVIAGFASPEKCPHCTATVPADEEFCPQCGYQRGSWQLSAPGQPSSASSTASEPASLAPGRFILSAADGRSFNLADGENIAGRGEVALRIDDGFISRQHARFTVNGDSVTVADLGSSNGTFVAGTRLEPNMATPLEEGGSVSLGQLELTLVANAAFSDSTIALASPEAGEDAAAETVSTEELVAAQAAASGWSLSAADGTLIELAPGESLCGRKADVNQIVIPDGFISGRHCVFSASAGTLTVMDSGSTNGTFVNGTQLAPNEPTELTAGDVLRLGQLELQVQHAAAPTAAAEPESDEAAPAD